MSNEIISKKTRTEFREFLVGWKLREIRNEFDAAGIECDDDYDPGLEGERRTLVEQYYHSLDFSNPSDVRKLISVYESVLVTALQRVEDYPDSSKGFERSVKALVQLLRRDGFDFLNCRLTSRRLADDAMALDHAEAVATKLNAEYVYQQVARLKLAVEDDPTLAIGTAKEFLETICTTILDARGATYGKDADVPRLVKLTLKELRLTPEDAAATDGALSNTIRRLAGGLSGAAQGIAELRNLQGTGHGKSAWHGCAEPRHARLAVGAATALGVFLFETYQEGEDAAS